MVFLTSYVKAYEVWEIYKHLLSLIGAKFNGLVGFTWNSLLLAF